MSSSSRSSATEPSLRGQRRHLLQTGARLAAAGAVLPCRAWSAESGHGSHQGHHPPEEFRQVLQAIRLSGQATMRFLGLGLYDARLWVGERFSAERFQTHPFGLELKYLRSIKGEDIVEQSLRQMQRFEPFDAAQAALWRESMSKAFPDVVNGDRLSGLHLPDGQSRFHLNGRATATLQDRRFARLFFGIWLDERTSEPRLRERLIGLRSQ